MIRKILFLFSVYLLILSQVGSFEQKKGSVYLLSHQWCRKCDKTTIIMDKLKLNLAQPSQKQGLQLQIQILTQQDGQLQANPKQQQESKYERKSIDLDDLQPYNSQAYRKSEQIYRQIYEKYRLQRSQVPFPTIWISCPYFVGIYQNEVTYEQLQYWIGIYCLRKLPSCRPNTQKQVRSSHVKKNDYQIQIGAFQFQREADQIIKFQIRHPFVKICIRGTDIRAEQVQSSQVPQTRQDKMLNASFFESVQKKIIKKPLFFTKFTHNIRNYLFETQEEDQVTSNKMGIFFIFNDASHPKIKQFIDIFKFLSDLHHQNKNQHFNEGKLNEIFSYNRTHLQKIQSEYHQSSVKDYSFQNKSELISSLLFFGACYNQDQRQCTFNYKYSIEQILQNKENDGPQKVKKHQFDIPFSFKGTKARNIKRLMQFSGIENKFQKAETQFYSKYNPKRSLFQIIAVHFDRRTHTIKGYEFQDFQTKLGTQFLFWLQTVHRHIFQKKYDQKITQSSQKQNQSSKKQNQQMVDCLSSQLVHVISERNLSVISANVRIGKIMEALNRKLPAQKTVKFSTLIKQKDFKHIEWNSVQEQRWRASDFKICIKNEKAFFSSDTQSIFKYMERTLNAKISFTQQSAYRQLEKYQISFSDDFQGKIKQQNDQQKEGKTKPRIKAIQQNQL